MLDICVLNFVKEKKKYLYKIIFRRRGRMNAALYATRMGMRTAARRTAMQSRNVNTNQAQSALSGAWNAILSRNFSYVTFIVLGAITVETIYGGVTTGLWKAMNSGKLYDDIDWSKFVEEEEDEDEDDE